MVKFCMSIKLLFFYIEFKINITGRLVDETSIDPLTIKRSVSHIWYLKCKRLAANRWYSIFVFFECIKNIFKIIFLLIIIRFRFGGLITLFYGLFLKVVCLWFRGVGNGMDYMALLRLSKIGFVIDSKFMYFTYTCFNITFLFMLFFGIFNILYNRLL